MRKQLLIKGETLNLNFEECLKQFEGFKTRMKLKYQFLNLEDDDLSQEIDLAMFYAYKSYDVDKGLQFTTLLYTVTKNHMQKIKRNNSKDKRKANDFTISLSTKVDYDKRIEMINTLKTKNDFTELIETVDLLNNLDSEVQTIIKLLYQGYSQLEIGKIIGCGQVQISRIRRKNALKLKEVC